MTTTDDTLATAPDSEAGTQPGAFAAMMFTDIEGSTQLLQALGERYTGVLLRHNALLRQAINDAGGHEVSTKGDSFFAVFTSVGDAVAAALEAQRLLQTEPWPDGAKLRVRMGIHAGNPRLVHDDYIGLDVHRAARISDAARGGQVILSRVVRESLGSDELPSIAEIRPLGRHRLKDLRYPETLYDVVAPGLMQEFGPVRSLSNRPTNLPNSGLDLVGRDREINELSQLLRDPARRLVTIHGPGGIGKSSLSRKVGSDALDAFPDGVHFIALAGLSDPDLVFSTVAQTIGVRDYASRPILEDIAADIGNERRLLIMDTFEHLLPAGAGLDQILGECPNLNVLVTSRTLLDRRDETGYVLEALDLPEENAGLDAAGASSSVQLFIARVRESDPDFALTDANAPIVANICRRLEGMPLALELGAARIRLLSPAKLLTRLNERLSVLKGGRREGTNRHRTLREAIAWSDNLLEPEDREVFQRLSVFAGGFDFQDAEEVLDPLVDADILDSVDSLVGKSLVRRTLNNGEPRFGMYDMIREYAAEILGDDGDARALRSRHMHYFAGLAEACGAFALHKDQRAHVLRLEGEADNIRAAMDFALAEKDVESLARLVYAMLWYWVSQAQFTEVLSWIEKSMALLKEIPDSHSSALLQEAACVVSMGTGDWASGYPHASEAVRIFTDLDETDGMMRAKILHSICATVNGEMEDPSPILGECVEYFTDRDADQAIFALILLGEGARMAEVFDAAEGCYGQALEILDRQGNVFWPGHLWQNIAHFRLKGRDWKAASEFLGKAYDLAEDYDFPMVSNLAVAGFGGVAVQAGDAENAARILGGSNHEMTKIGAEFEPTDKADIESYVAETRGVLGDAAYDALMAEGASMDWDDLKSLARRFGPSV